MKGIELPINTIIVIAIALLVLLGITALWMSSWGGGSQGVTMEAAKAAGCGALMRNSTGCAGADTTAINYTGTYPAVPRMDVNNDHNIDGGDTLQHLCETYYGVAAGDQVGCRRVCGCGV